jgi:hypothetical protein
MAFPQPKFRVQELVIGSNYVMKTMNVDKLRIKLAKPAQSKLLFF